MGVAKKLKRAFSLKKKDKNKEKVEKDKQIEEAGPLPKKSNSMISLIRKVSTLRRDKSKNKSATSSHNTTIEISHDNDSVRLRNGVQTDESQTQTVGDIQPINVKEDKPNGNIVAKEEQTIPQVPIDEPKNVGKEVMAESKSEVIPAEQTENVNSAEEQKAIETLDEFEKTIEALDTVEKVLDCIDDAVKDSSDSCKDGEETATEVLRIYHDKTDTVQSGDDVVKTVEVEQERKVSRDGSTVISSSTKTTTTTVSPNGFGNGVTTEVKEEFAPTKQCFANEASIHKPVSRYPQPFVLGSIFIALLIAFVSVWPALLDSVTAQ